MVKSWSSNLRSCSDFVTGAFVTSGLLISKVLVKHRNKKGKEVTKNHDKCQNIIPMQTEQILQCG